MMMMLIPSNAINLKTDISHQTTSLTQYVRLGFRICSTCDLIWTTYDVLGTDLSCYFESARFSIIDREWLAWCVYSYVYTHVHEQISHCWNDLICLVTLEWQVLYCSVLFLYVCVFCWRGWKAWNVWIVNQMCLGTSGHAVQTVQICVFIFLFVCSLPKIGVWLYLLQWYALIIRRSSTAIVLFSRLNALSWRWTSATSNHLHLYLCMYMCMYAC